MGYIFVEIPRLIMTIALIIRISTRDLKRIEENEKNIKIRKRPDCKVFPKISYIVVLSQLLFDKPLSIFAVFCWSRAVANNKTIAQTQLCTKNDKITPMSMQRDTTATRAAVAMREEISKGKELPVFFGRPAAQVRYS